MNGTYDRFLMPASATAEIAQKRASRFTGILSDLQKSIETALQQNAREAKLYCCVKSEESMAELVSIIRAQGYNVETLDPERHDDIEFPERIWVTIRVTWTR